ncbi:hypothetical protein GCM10009529_13220 [Micropruina glycogenica]
MRRGGCGMSTIGGMIYMTYEAPTIQEVGSVAELTLGQPLPIRLDDNTFWWGATPGSR